jgi:hypothetical protein
MAQRCEKRLRRQKFPLSVYRSPRQLRKLNIAERLLP